MKKPEVPIDPMVDLETNYAEQLAQLTADLSAPPVPVDDAEDDKRRGSEQLGSLTLIDGKWHWRWREPADELGKRKRRSKVIGTIEQFPTRAEARAETLRLRAFVMPQRLPKGSSPMWPEVCARYLWIDAALTRTLSQQQIYYVVKNHLLPCFAKLRLHEVGTPQVQEFVSAQARRGVSRKTIKTRLGYLVTLLAWAQGQGLAANVPRSGAIKLPKPADLGLTLREKSYTTDERSLVLAASADKPWFRTLLAVLGFAGVRIGEALALTWAHIDLPPQVAAGACAIRIRQAAVNGAIAAPKSRAAVRDVPIYAELLSILLEFQAVWEYNKAGLLFASPHDSNRPRWSSGVLAAHLDPLLRAQAIKSPERAFHGLRHLFAHSLADAGVSTRGIMQLMGHTSLAAAELYTKSPSIAVLHQGVQRACSLKVNQRPNAENDQKSALEPKCSATP